MNIRHDIDPTLVKGQVEEKIKKHESRRVCSKGQAQAAFDSYERAKLEGSTGCWSRPPSDPGYVDPMIDGWIDLERERYALVRVIELPIKGKHFVLVYGDSDDRTVTGGTGPFDSFDEAAAWFLGGGR